MKVVITGAAGFVGRWTVKAFEEAGHQVTGFDLDGSDVDVDLTDLRDTHLALSVAKPEAVIHLAALAGSTGKGGGAESMKNPFMFLDKNPRIALNVYETCKTLGIRKVVCMSSFSVYGKAPCPIDEDTPLNPNTPYGASKVCVEAIARIYAEAYGVKSVIFRVPLICGEGQKEENALRQFVHQALKGEPLEVWGDGSTLREWVHPEDVARAYILGLKHLEEWSRPYEVFVLGNFPWPMKNLAHMIIAKVGQGEMKLLEEKPNLFDQFTDHAKSENNLGWLPKVETTEIIERVVKEAKA